MLGWVFFVILNYYNNYKIYINNTTWVILEKFISLLINFLLSIIISRYLGPEKFGDLVYVISLVTLFSIVGHVGLSGLVVKRIVENEKDANVILGTSFSIKTFAYISSIIFLLLFTFFTQDGVDDVFLMVFILSLPLCLRGIEVIELRFQSKVDSKYTSLSRLTSVLISSALKLIFIYTSLSLIYLVIAQAIQTIIFIFLIIIFYKYKNYEAKSWVYNKDEAGYLLKNGSLIFLGSIFAMIYLKIDIVMLKFLTDSSEVGIYSVAASLSEAWYFIPTAIVATVSPRLIKLKNESKELYNKRYQQLFDLLFMMGLVVSIVVSLISFDLINFTYGEDYINAASILVIHVWASIFVAMRAGFSRWIIIENMYTYSIVTQGLGALINVILNYYLIPDYQGVGAAYATLISYITAGYLSLLINNKTRIVFIMMTKSLLSPIRYTRNIYTLYLNNKFG